MITAGERRNRTQLIALLVILLTAVFLRLWQIDQIPPGLTHDEADHGITAWSIVQGAREIYFTVGYGREPLFDYATALVMSWLGPTYLAGRLTAVFFSLLTIVLLYGWTKSALDSPTALLAAAGLAVGFWGAVTGRLALRSVTLPAFFLAGMWAYWQLVTSNGGVRNLRGVWYWILGAGLLFGLAFYTYIPARGLWLVLPGGLIYLAIFARPVFKRLGGQTAVVLLIAASVGSPLFSYLNAHPDAEVRIGELSAPLTAAQQGNFQPLWQNMLASLRLFFIEGDPAWRYNIAGQPWLSLVMAVFFLLGLGVTVWWVLRPLRQNNPETVQQGFTGWVLLLWLGLGFAPVLITGPELSTTQAVGMQPVLYILIAIGLRQSGHWRLWLGKKNLDPNSQGLIIGNRLLGIGAVGLFGVTAVITFRDLQQWAAHPQVRVQYESTMVAAVDYVNQTQTDGSLSISTIAPGQFHTPALVEMTLTQDVSPFFFNASGSLLVPLLDLPPTPILVPGFTPIPEEMAKYWETAVLEETLPLNETDLDRPLAIYRLDIDRALIDWETKFEVPAQRVEAGEGISLLGIDLQTPRVQKGQQVILATWWLATRRLSQEARLFTHMVGRDGIPIAQADRLDAPAQGWQSGVWLIQLHTLTVPPDTAVGTYPLVIGLYTCSESCENGQRLPLLIDGQVSGDTYSAGAVEVVP